MAAVYKDGSHRLQSGGGPNGQSRLDYLGIFGNTLRRVENGGKHCRVVAATIFVLRNGLQLSTLSAEQQGVALTVVTLELDSRR